MRFLVALAALVLAAAGPVVAQPPKGPPPLFKIVSETNRDKGQILFKELGFKTEFRTEKRQVLQNGQTIDVEVQVQVLIPFEQVVTINAANSRVITLDGKQLRIDDVWNRVKAKT